MRHARKIEPAGASSRVRGSVQVLGGNVNACPAKSQTYRCMRIATSYLETDVRVPGVSLVSIALNTASPDL